jgi:hypothetical protein
MKVSDLRGWEPKRKKNRHHFDSFLKTISTIKKENLGISLFVKTLVDMQEE